jgi:hypothetical protein
MTTVRQLFNLKKVEGEVGVEIEIEGRHLRALHDLTGWRTEGDGSLRGDESIELVLRKPCKRENIARYLKRVSDAAQKPGVIVEDSGRAGVHVHLNVQELDITQVYNVLCAYMIFEDALIEYCGADRVGNLFCLRVRDADYLLDLLRDAVVEKNFHVLQDDVVRYASVNVCALSRYGSLEFRAMRSTTDHEKIQNWINMLLSIRDWAVTFNNPQEIVESFSLLGPPVVFDTVFGDEPLVEFNPQAMFEGVRRAQYLAYAPDEWEFDEYRKALKLLDDENIKDWRHYDRLQVLLETEQNFFNDHHDREVVINAARNYLAKFDKEIDLEVEKPEPAMDTAPAPKVKINRIEEAVLELQQLQARKLNQVFVDEEQHGQENWEADPADEEDEF